jgi:hypothetical protein
LRAVQLALSLAPKQPKDSWYAEAVAAVQKYRDDLWAREQQGWTEKRKPIVEKLKNEINVLDEKQRNAERKGTAAEFWEFAMWVWTEWPPKTEGQCMVSTQSHQSLPPLLLMISQRSKRITQSRHFSQKTNNQSHAGP